MQSRGCGAILATRWIPPVAFAWAIILIQLSSFVHGRAISPPATDQRPRAALVSLAHEHDLQAILSSIYQLEDTFNCRYQYDWVFFSTKPLSDDFRRQTSNATTATCIYEVISEGNWVVSPSSAPRTWHLDTPPFPQEYVEDVSDVDQSSSSSLLGQIDRWNSGPFAREKRLRDYDWFWKIEPGAQFTHDIYFDVFRFMRDHGIVYGFNDAMLDAKDMRAHSQQVESFIDKHPHLLHADAHVSWLLNSHRYQEHDCLEEDNAAERKDAILLEGSPSRVSRRKADWQQEENDDGDNDTSSPSEAFASWLSSIYKAGLTGLSPTFDIGSLAFFRGQNHQELLDHLDLTGDFYYRRPREVSVPTISASMFLPQKSVWNFRRRDVRHTSRPSPPKYTPDPEFNMDAASVDRTVDVAGPERPGNIQEPRKDTAESMAELFALWELMAQDLGRQDAIPGLQSGHTVIDERNFSLR